MYSTMTHAYEDSKREGEQISEAVVRICSSKWVFLRISQHSEETPVLESLPAILLKRDSSAGVFLGILQKCLDQPFYRTPPVEFLFRYYLIHVYLKKYSATA